VTVYQMQQKHGQTGIGWNVSRVVDSLRD
jgi:hypothetical protein